MQKKRTVSEDSRSRPASLGAQVLLLSQEFGQFKSGVGAQFTQIGNNLDQLRNEIRDMISGKNSKVTSWLPLIIALGGLFWFVLNLQMNAANKTLADIVSRLEVTTNNNSVATANIPTIQQQNADSMRDRGDMRSAITRLAETQATIQANQARETSLRSSKDAEIETQFRAMEGFANLTRVYDNRMFALLWEKSNGTPFPAFQYYPRISTDGDSTGGMREQ